MSCDNMYKVTLNVRGCRNCDICRINEYIVQATNEDAAIESIQKLEFSVPREYHGWYLNWKAQIVAKPMQISITLIR